MKNKMFFLLGFCVLFFGCKATYTFQNNSSFAVTVFPEFGEDFQVQSGTIKSFESSHKNMNLSYSPPDYVAARKIKSTTWEFTNWDFYYDETRKFLIYPPEGWEIVDWPGLKYKLIVASVDRDFAPNMIFDEGENGFNRFINYVSANLNKIIGENNFVSRERFQTQSGIEGFKVETTTEKLVQFFYILDIGQTAFIVTCSAPLQSEIDYDEIFDSSVQTLEFLY